VRQLLAQGMLMVEGDYSTLALTPESGAVLRGDRKVLMRREPAKAARAPKQSRTAAAPVEEMSDEAKPVFEKLRAWRGQSAKEQGVPAYVIFHDATLRQIAALAPTSLQQLGTINGVGENKLAKYGQQILDTLTEALDRPGRAAPDEPPAELDFEAPPEDYAEEEPGDYFPPE